MPKTISVVIPTFNRNEKLARLIDSVLKSKHTPSEILVIDGTPYQASKSIQPKYKTVKFRHYDTEQSLSDMRNSGMKIAKGDYILFVDDDSVLDEDCIGELVKTFDILPTIGMAVPYMLYLSEPNRVWCAGARIMDKSLLTPLIVPDGIHTAPFPCGTAPNAFMLSRKAIDLVGLYDTFNFPIHHAEADYGIRLKRKNMLVYTNPKAKLWHDIGIETPYKLDNRHPLRPYHVMFGEVVLRKKWSNRAQALLWTTSILAVYVIMLARDTKINRIRYIRNALGGYIQGWQHDLGKRNDENCIDIL
jgi:GT2 family glycosyltransferase